MKSELVVFDLDDENDFQSFLALWRSSVCRRPHDHPQYLRLMASMDRKPCAMVYFEFGVPLIMYTFYLHEIGGEGSFVSRSGYKHMISTYGYGGPVMMDVGSGGGGGFEMCFNKYIAENRVVSEFVREDIFPQFKVPRGCGRIKQQDNVVVNLNKSTAELFASYKHSVRKNVNRAVASELIASFDFDGEQIDQFVSVYHATMARTNAKEAFLIPAAEFRKFNQYLSTDRIGFYVHILLGAEVVATELVLKSPLHLYSFLGGSITEYSSLRPNDFLKHKVNEWGIENGYLGYVLGGGVQPYDGIYNFKLAFDPGGAHSFFIQKNVFDSKVYSELNAARGQYEVTRGAEWHPNPDFFPSFLS